MNIWRFWRRRHEEERELQEEFQFHLRQEEQLRINRGELPDAARQSARRDFGNVGRVQDATREAWGIAAVERLAQDVRFALRMLSKSPAFTALAIAALALGIGATTAMFSVVYSVLLRPLAFPEPERLVMGWELRGAHTNVVQTQNFLDWRARNRSFVNIAAYGPFPANLVGEGEPVQLPGLAVTAGFFEILGVPPQLGRTISAADDAFGASPVVVLSNGLWQRRFGGRPDAIGKRVVMNGQSSEIVGAMPAGFVVPGQTVDLFLPMQINPATAPRGGRNFRTLARLKPGVTLRDAQADLAGIAVQTARERPQANAGWSATVVPLLEQTVGNSRLTLLILLAAVGFVLLIACANVANLLLMRGAARRREMTVRVALGAGRWRLLHQLMVESILLALVGGGLGFLLASWGIPAMVRVLPEGFPLPRSGEIAVDRPVLAFTLLISLGCGIFFGLFPALQVNRVRLSQTLHGARGGTASTRMLRNLLVVSEVALAVLLVIGGGLMVRSFLLLHETDPGFRVDRLTTYRMLLVPSKNAKPERRAAVVRDMLDRVRGLPSVSAASSIHLLPLSGGNSGSWAWRLDRPAPAPGSYPSPDFSIISDGYFKTMGIPLLAGRDFDTHDVLGAPGVGMINRRAAETFYPGESPIGKRMHVAWGDPEAVEIVGVAGDNRHDGLDSPPVATIFLPQSQRTHYVVTLVVRGDVSAAVVKEQIRAVDPDQGTQTIQTMEQVMSASIARPRMQATLLAIFGGVALLLACVGIYAVVSYSVEQRTRELGIRLALGALPGSILRLVLREGLVLAGIGIAAGVVAALGLTRYLSSMLYTVRPADPLVYASVSAILAVAAMAGCYIPARRATRVDAAIVLRDE